jgi:hypothetical protein
VVERLGHAREAGDHPVDAGDLEDAEHGPAGDGQQHLAALGPGPFVRVDQRVDRRRIAEPRAGQVDHERPGPILGRPGQGCPQPFGVGDVDLLGRRHH